MVLSHHSFRVFAYLWPLFNLVEFSLSPLSADSYLACDAGLRSSTAAAQVLYKYHCTDHTAADNNIKAKISLCLISFRVEMVFFTVPGLFPHSLSYASISSIATSWLIHSLGVQLTWRRTKIMASRSKAATAAVLVWIFFFFLLAVFFTNKLVTRPKTVARAAIQQKQR